MPGRSKAMLGIAALAGAAAIAPLTGLAAADSPPHANVVEIVNDTPYVILHLYAHAEGMSDWEEDALGEEVIEPGKSLKLDFNVGANFCRFEMRIEFIDGDPLYLRSFDACRETVLHVTVER